MSATDITYNNPVLIADRDGKTHCLFCVEYMRCFSLHSDDDGATWSAPLEITTTFETYRSAYDWKVLATGPDHGIQTRSGRLVVPIWMSTGTGGNAHRPLSHRNDFQRRSWSDLASRRNRRGLHERMDQSQRDRGRGTG